MAKNQQTFKLLIGIILGILLSHLLHRHFNINIINTTINNQQKYPIYKEIIENDNSNISSGKQLVFIGVMTAAKYLNTRAKAVFDTWGHNISGSLVFFSSENSYSESLPLVSLVGIDDGYPPQKKSFAMLKYIHDNYIDKYEWFIRADDDVYFRMDRLETLLRSIDSRKLWFIGQTGKGNTDEFGLLALNNDENFCMGGPGVILSSETLKRISPYLEDCLNNLYTTHEDVELGRCVKKFAGISCTWSYEMQVILYHNQSGNEAFRGNLKQREVHRAITLHPVKYSEYMNRLHKYVQGLQIQSYRHKIVKLYQDIMKSFKHTLSFNNATTVRTDEIVRSLQNILPDDLDSYEDFLTGLNFMGDPVELNRFKPTSLNDILEWNYFAKSLYISNDLNPKRRLGSTVKEGLNDILQEIMEIINSLSKQRGRLIDYKETLYGYWRLDPIHGVDVILDLLLVYKKYRGHKMTVPVRRHAYVQMPFTGIDIKEVSRDMERQKQDNPLFFLHQKVIKNFNENTFEDENKNSYINFILPLQGRYQTFQRFMAVYEKVCIYQNEFTKLIIVLFKDTNNLDWKNSLNLINQYKSKTNHNIKVLLIEEAFSRGRALQIGTDVIKDNELMFFIDVDIIFDSNLLRRIRSNTEQGKLVYFPIVYSLYKNNIFNRSYVLDYKSNNFLNLINEENGFWRQFGFGIVGLYKSDFKLFGGFNQSISGWGLEDVNLFDNVIKTNINVIRAPDPSLIHVYHTSYCNNLVTSQKIMCQGTKVSLFGSLSNLENYIILKDSIL